MMKMNVRDSLYADFKDELNKTDFNSVEDCDNSFNFMLDQLHIQYEDKDENDNSLTASDVKYIENILLNDNFFSLQGAYHEIVNYLDGDYAVEIAKFKDEEDNICFGILQENGSVLCLDCLGIFGTEDYELLEKYKIYEMSTEFQEEYKKWIRK